MSELGPISQAILDYVQSQPDYIEIFKMIYEVARKTGISHKRTWYFRRLVGLTFEGRIETNVTRKGDKLGIRFRRIQKDSLKELPQIEEFGD